MKVFISADMEGVAGVVDWEQCRPGGAGYDVGCRLLLGEVNAAIEGALAAGADAITVTDAHGLMANLAPDGLTARASYRSGRNEPDYMMAGLDESYDAVLFIGYHGAMPSPSVLSHTYNPRVVSDARIGGVRAGESGINALAAAGHGVPIAVVTGDQHVGPEAEPFCPGISAVVVKRSLGRESAESLHPNAARAAIRDGVTSSLGRLTQLRPPPVRGDLEVDVLTTDMAVLAARVRGVERTGERTVTIATTDALDAYRAFTAAIAITRGLSAS
ncbi:MAG TPA: M55 family metallopeptidase [Mycobacteriales bacterium]|nr:M55 family metallopeptidase [Mycobacteriales bacterium]